VTYEKHEWNKRFCDNCKPKKEIGDLCYMRTLKDALLPAGDKVLYVFYDFETTQNIRYKDEAKSQVPNLVCLQQFCSRCEDEKDVGVSVRCARRKHSFLVDPVGDLLSYRTEPRPGLIRSSL